MSTHSNLGALDKPVAIGASLSKRLVAPLPKAPVLDWPSLWPSGPSPLPSVADLQHRAFTTGGRAALLAALKQMQLPPGSVVLVPSYHCPTMVAPVLLAGLTPAYFPIGNDGLPLLSAVSADLAGSARAMIVAHYFGLPQSLRAVQQWCQARGVQLIEDCAHSFFGRAGELPVGHWGDYATASISKFFPVSEAGLLGSAHHALRHMPLSAPGLRQQVKSVVDVVEFAQRHQRLSGLRQLLAPALWLKNRSTQRAVGAAAEGVGPADAQAMMLRCDMARSEQQAAWMSRVLYASVTQGRIVQNRRRNYSALAAALRQAPGAALLQATLPAAAAPYVCPLLVQGRERADAVYAQLRDGGLAVFRWEYRWPGTPNDAHDSATTWSHQMLQLLCHQDLSLAQIERMASSTLQLLHGH